MMPSWLSLARSGLRLERAIGIEPIESADIARGFN
jgi:hypothetical protein